MNELTNGTVYVTHLRAQHHRLHNMILQIERELPFVAEESLPWEPHAHRFVESLTALRDELAAHFLEEQQGGCLEEAVCRCPSLGQEANRLLQEHRVLLAELDEIIANVSRTTTARRIRELGFGFERFAKSLHEHEDAENRLLECGFGAAVD
ncbi:MAG: hypothetical protein RIC55_15990 [Pirellulaceae bacterium]